jgi:flagellar FliL protein
MSSSEAQAPKRLLGMAVPFLGGLAIAAGGGFAAMQMGYVGSGAQAPEAVSEVAGQHAEPAIPPQFVDLPDIIVNLVSDPRQPQFLRLRLSIEVPEKGQVRLVGDLMPRIQDALQPYLRALRPEDLQGGEAITRLKRELLARTTFAAPEAGITDVLIKEMIVN